MDGELVNRNEVTPQVSNETAPEQGHAVIFEKPGTDMPGTDSAPLVDAVPRALLQHMPPLYYADRDGRFVFRNAAFDAIAQSAFPEFQSRERREQPRSPVPRELQEIFDRLTAGGEQVKLRQSLVVDGETCHFRSCHSKVVEDGQTVGFCGIYTSVTLEAEAVMQSARTETRFQDIIRSASDWVWETDHNINLSYVSNRISEALETPPSALMGRHLFSLGAFEDTPGNGPPRPDLAAALMPFRGRIFLMPDKQGRTRRISLTGIPVFDDVSGRFMGYRGTGTDVTRQHEAEARARKTQQVLEISLRELRSRNLELDRALQEAQSAARAKTEFLGKMSHELRTPLNAIIGFSEMSVQQTFGALSPRYLSYFRDIHGAAHHLLSIITDSLDAANVDSSKISIAPAPIRLSEVLAQVRSIIAVRAEQGEVDIDAVRLPDNLVVLADPGRTRQILVNLLTNAIKFTNPGGSVGMDARAIDGDMIECTVWDTGIGIPKDQQEHIFESFHQVDSDLLSGPTEGTGLGLTISRQLAQLMGGDISVDSAPGRGARFTVRLPSAALSDARVPETAQ
ncbi:MAG: PAS domain-containing sensor histidine kinase [Alphaproteobacteria bacterium]